MARGGAHNRASTHLRVPASVRTQRWEFDGSGRVWGYRPGLTVWTSAAVGVVAERPVVVVGSYDHNVYCLDARTGEVQWRFTTGDAVAGTPILWDSGAGMQVFATSSDRLVYALDAKEGRRIWIHSVADFKPTLGGARLSSPCLGTAGRRVAVFVGHWVWDKTLVRNRQEAGVTALDVRTGEVIWRKSLGDNEMTAPTFAVTAAGRRLYVGSTNGNLYALDADSGKTMWRHTELDAIRGQVAATSGPDGARVLVASKAGIVRCLKAEDGRQVWKYRTGDWVTGAVAVEQVLGRDMVLVGSYDRSLYALDLLSGSLIWRYVTRGGIYGAISSVDREGRPLLLINSWDHHLHLVDARDGTGVHRAYTGRPLWDITGLAESNWASVVSAEINGSWMAYVGSYDGTFYALPVATMREVATGMGQNVGFFASFPIALSAVTGLAMWLTRRYRRGVAAAQR